MNRFGLFLFLLVAFGLASGTPAEGRRAARRARVDVGRTEFDAELPAVLATSAPVHLVAPAALPATVARPRPGVAVRVRATDLSSCSPVEPAGVPACSRAPPLLG